MWDSFNKLDMWLRAAIIIVPLAIASLWGVALFIKTLRADKVEIGKDGLKLDDPDTHTEIKNADGIVVGSVDTISTNKTNTVNVEINKDVKS